MILKAFKQSFFEIFDTFWNEVKMISCARLICCQSFTKQAMLNWGGGTYFSHDVLCEQPQSVIMQILKFRSQKSFQSQEVYLSKVFDESSSLKMNNSNHLHKSSHSIVTNIYKILTIFIAIRKKMFNSNLWHFSRIELILGIKLIRRNIFIDMKVLTTHSVWFFPKPL